MKIDYEMLKNSDAAVNSIQRASGKIFLEKNKTFLKFCDILLIVCFFMNIGALVITNTLVMKNSEIKIIEANPVAAENHDLETVPEAKNAFTGLIVMLFSYVFLASYYIYLRFNITSKSKLFFFVLFLLSLSILWGYDFFNDLGYLIGHILFR